jgi:hypothetical protein
MLACKLLHILQMAIKTLVDYGFAHGAAAYICELGNGCDAFI